jgi:exonuclease SbcD
MEGTVRYSGSPLAYSFSEAGHTKSVSLIDLDASGDVTITEIPTPVPRPLTVISGTLEDVLANPAHTAIEDHWVSVTLTDPLLPPGPMAQLRNRFPHALHLSHQPERTTEATEATRAERIEGLHDRDVVMNFFVDQALREPDENEVAIIDEALDATRPGGSEH